MFDTVIIGAGPAGDDCCPLCSTKQFKGRIN